MTRPNRENAPNSLQNIGPVLALISRSKRGGPMMHPLERLSQMGHREIARSHSACKQVLWRAGGAGVITAATVSFKSVILHSSVSLTEGAALIALNFVASFLIMQLLGFRLATKQSSLIGSTLAKRFRELRCRCEYLWSARTQLSGAAGNLFFVIPACLLFEFVYEKIVGAPFLEAHTAREMLASLHPTHTPTLAYATLTGLLLWFCAWFAATLTKKHTSAAFNTTLGIGLAVIPTVGKLLHLPIDVRHFTLSGGMVALSTATLGVREAWKSGLGAAFVGVLCIGFLNFFVSFVLAFRATQRARLKPKADVRLAPCTCEVAVT